MYDLAVNVRKKLSMYVISLVCIRVKGFESECFKIDSGVRQDCIMTA